MSDAEQDMESASTPLLVDETDPLLEDNNEEDNQEVGHVSEAYPSERRQFYRRLASLMLSPVTDEQDSLSSILMGLVTMFIAGSFLGAVMPGNDALNPPWYRVVSSMIGYTFFTMWSISFYPQVINNFRRRTTQGLSADFCGLNCVGFAAYATYNVAMFYSDTIKEQYRARHGPDAEITVQSNDVAFAVHAFILASITFIQIGYYDGFRSQRPSRIIETVIVIMLVMAAIYPIFVSLNWLGTNWLDYLYLLSYMKIVITLIKYVPQVILNYKRKSTIGFSIWQILLDFGGGVLSDLQLILDSAALHDFSGITGNPAKLVLGMVSIIFDCIFMAQHFLLYREATAPPEPALDEQAKRDAETLDSVLPDQNVV